MYPWKFRSGIRSLQKHLLKIGSNGREGGKFTNWNKIGRLLVTKVQPMDSELAMLKYKKSCLLKYKYEFNIVL